MQRMPILAVATLLVVMAASVTAQDVEKLKYPPLNPLKLPKVEKVTLENGLRIYVVEDHTLPTFSLSARINCGSYLEPADKIGLASICGTVLRTGGTEKWTGDEIDEMLEAVGASVETNIGLLSGSASANCLTEYQDLVLDVLTEILRRPVFDNDKIELAKVQERTAIARRNDDPQQLGFREFRKLIYGPQSVYARHTEYATIDAITRDDLVAFHKQWFRPENIQIAVWGDFKAGDIIDAIKKRFGDWSRGQGEVPPPPKVNYTFEPHVYYIEKSDVTQSGIFMGHIGGLVTDPDYAARIVMNNIMGGGGLSSRMFNAVRSREGLAYAAFGQYTANIAYPGIFVNYVGTKSETTGKAIREAIKVIESMQTEPPTPEEMRKGKDSYLNSFVFNFDSKAEIVNRLMTYDFYGLPEDFLNRIKEQVEKVTPDDVVAAAKKHLHPDALKLLVVGNGADFDVRLDALGLGPLDTIDITIPPPPEEQRELSVTPENLQKGQEVLARAVEVHGGLAAFKKVRSLSGKGTFTLLMGQQEMPLSFTEYIVFPDKHSRIIEAFGRKMVDIRNGSVGWKTSQMTGQVEAKTEQDLADDEKEAARNNIAIFQTVDNPSYRAVFDGTGESAGREVDFVVILDQEDQPICRFGFDHTTGELVSKSYKDKTMMGEGTIEVIYGKLTDVSGLKLPLQATHNFRGQKIGEIEYSELLINPDIPDSAFEKPE